MHVSGEATGDGIVTVWPIFRRWYGIDQRMRESEFRGGVSIGCQCVLHTLQHSALERR
jgi:hypothetical protein